ncbi:MAG: hypothetical protein QM222_04665, partial [Bacillota bacterium]|nr:hypothetical protein [Bacillota bacterium]
MLGNKSCKASNYLKLIILISIFVITTVVAVSCDKKGRPTGKEEPDVTKEPESDDLVPSGNLDPSEDAFESLDPNQPIFGSLVLVRDNQLFYKKGSSKNYSIVSKNLTTQEENEIVTVELPYSDVGNFCLKGDYIYYDRDDRLHKVSLDGSNDTKLYKRKADLLGFYGDDVIVFDKSSYSLIRINNDGEYKTLLKKGYFYMEATVMAEGIYYILPSSEKKDEPSVQLYYMDFEGNNKTLLLEDREVFHLKSNNNEAFFIARDSHKFKIYKVKDKKLDIIYNINREDLEALGYRWDFLLPTGVYLLGVTSTHVYYGVEFDADGKEALHVYSVKTDGSGHELFY